MSKIEVKEGVTFERLDSGDVRIERKREVPDAPKKRDGSVPYAIDTVTLDAEMWDNVVDAMRVYRSAEENDE